MLMATMRQSIISLGYVLILLPRMEDGSEVLDQRNINQNQTQNKLQEEVDEIISRLEEIERSGEDVPEETVKELQ